MKLFHNVFFQHEEHDLICITDHGGYFHVHAGCRDGYRIQLSLEQLRNLKAEIETTFHKRGILV